MGGSGACTDLSGAGAVTGLEDRLRALEARAEIEALMQRYAAAADAKYTAARQKRDPRAVAAAAAEQAACFTEDGLWDGAGFGGTLSGRDAIAAFFQTSPWLFTAHTYAGPRIELDGEQARAVWRLVEIGVREEDGRVVLLAGTAHQTLCRTVEGWRIASMSFDMLHGIEVGAAPEALRCLIPLGENFA